MAAELKALKQHCELRSEPLLSDPTGKASAEERMRSRSLETQLAASALAVHVLTRQAETSAREIENLEAKEHTLNEARKKKAQACQRGLTAVRAQLAASRQRGQGQPVGAIAAPKVKEAAPLPSQVAEEAAEEAAEKEAPPPPAAPANPLPPAAPEEGGGG